MWHNLSGQRFGKLLVIKRVGSTNKGARLWLCECSCGRTVEKNSSDLVRGRAKACPYCSHNKARIKVGARFGRLIVLKEEKRGRHHYSYCRCDCGNKKWIRSCSLKGDKTHSCGCISKEGKKQAKHGMSDTRIYRIYLGIKKRCYNPNEPSYKNYGMRGISVADEWMGDNGFDTFKTWAESHGYKEGLTIERLDVDGNYEPSNCMWITKGEQSDNRRNTRYMTYKGETKSIKKWSEEVNIPRRVLYYRTTHGWSDEKALTTPVKH